MKFSTHVTWFCCSLSVLVLIVSQADAFEFREIVLDGGSPFRSSMPIMIPQSIDDDDQSDEGLLFASEMRLIAQATEVKREPDSVKIVAKEGVFFGKLSSNKITITTSYGVLEVPILKLRKFTPGLRNHKAEYEKIQKLLEELGGSDFKKRELAQKALIEMGAKIRYALAEKKNSENSELVRRIRIVTEKITEGDDSGKFQRRLDDVVETTISPYPIVGDISPKSFTIKTKYGAMKLNLADILYAERFVPGQIVDLNKKVRVTGTNLAQRTFKKTKIKVKKGERIRIRASGTIHMSNYNYTSTPNGNSSMGTYTSSPVRIYGGTLVMRIGDSGKIVKAGSRIVIKADADGEIQFAIGMSSSYARRNAFTGQYDVQVKIDRTKK